MWAVSAAGGRASTAVVMRAVFARISQGYTPARASRIENLEILNNKRFRKNKYR